MTECRGVGFAMPGFTGIGGRVRVTNMPGNHGTEGGNRMSDTHDGVEAIIHYTRCWSCMLGQCFDPFEWHSWAGFEDFEHARDTGQDDPSEQPCACQCAGVRESHVEYVREVTE